MTENKRFDCFENTWGSRTITDSGKCIGAETAVDLLNQLSEENEQLKQQSNSVYEIVKEYVMNHHCISTMRMLKKIENVMWNDDSNY